MCSLFLNLTNVYKNLVKKLFVTSYWVAIPSNWEALVLWRNIIYWLERYRMVWQEISPEKIEKRTVTYFFIYVRYTPYILKHIRNKALPTFFLSKYLTVKPNQYLDNNRILLFSIIKYVCFSDVNKNNYLNLCSKLAMSAMSLLILFQFSPNSNHI